MIQKWLLAPKRLAILLFLATVLAAVPGLGRLKMETDATASFVPQHGAEAETYKRYLDLFTPDFGTVVIATGDVWRPERWQAFTEMAEEIEALDVVERVIGLPNSDYVSGTDEQVEVKDFPEVAPEAGDALRDAAVAYEPYRQSLVTADGNAIALYVACQREVDAVTFDAAVTPIVEKYKPLFADDGGGDLFQSGDQYVSAEIARQTQASTTLLLISILIMLIVAGIATRSVVGGLLAAGSGIFAAFFTFALMGYLGIKLNSVNSLVINMLIPLGTAYTIHALKYTHRESRYLFGILPVSGIVPFVFAAGTTSLGFATTAISPVLNVQQFGMLGAFGIVMVLYTTLLLTFPLAVKSGFTPPPIESLRMPAFVQWSMGLPKGVTLALVLILFGLTAAGMSRVRVNYEAIDYLLPANQARIDADRGTSLFSRHNMPMMITGDGPNAALEPAMWQKVDGLLAGIRADYPEIKTSWIYDQVKQLNLAFTADEAEPVAMPDSADLIAQYLLLFDENDIQPYIDADRQDLAVVLQVPFRNSTEFREFLEDLNGRIAAAGLNAELTGREKFFFEVGDQIARNNIQATFSSALVLFITFLFMVRSFPVAFIALLVNTLPVFACLAFMGLAGIDLDLGNSIVATVALGLVVDDTGHLIMRYRNHRRDGFPPRTAVDLMMREHWSPVIVSTLVIVLGFSVLNAAPLVPFHSFARALSATMAFAILGDLLLLPPLLIHFDRDRKKETAA